MNEMDRGDRNESRQLEVLLACGAVTADYVATAGRSMNPYSISQAICSVLSSYEPVIPSKLYGHFMSPMADVYMDKLVRGLLGREVFELLMNHFVFLLQRRLLTPRELSATIGKHLLRCDDRSVADEDDDDAQEGIETTTLILAVEKIIAAYQAVTAYQSLTADGSGGPQRSSQQPRRGRQRAGLCGRAAAQRGGYPEVLRVLWSDQQCV